MMGRGMVNQSVPQTPKEFVKAMSIIHGAFIAGLLLFGLAAVILKGSRQTSIKLTNDPFIIVVPLLAVAGLLAGKLIFKNQLSRLDNELSLKEKVKGYQAATITRFALLEGPALFAIVAFILSWNMFFLLIAGVLIVYFSFLKPTKLRTETDLKLSDEEKLVFDRQDEILR